MPIMSIEDKRDQLVEELIPFEDHLERLTYVIDRAKDLPGLEDAYKIDTFLIKGCVSQLWIFPSFSDGKCNFQADSEASITKGTASLLCELYSGETPEDVLRLEPDFLAEVGITQHLSPNRRNGLTGVREKIKAYAQMQLDRTG
ncbi:MAG: SufE family protein [Verrucomicrobiota bacterium]|jgi:cysteine desulfuration protein SufE|nr:Fe-S metabolism protein SufE [Opitutales bacterium]MEC7394097.1 SufE family protein [Verrucomicrobiota bacterium]MEC8779487.1 SufE family protein [Verrucomicrobiota bacterium]|tara:strand:+ start:3262 stop:3693 length:432 start_codon:yes stop_codon:yes gene_type:complete